MFLQRSWANGPIRMLVKSYNVQTRVWEEVETVEPEFEVGDWVCEGSNSWRIVEIKQEGVEGVLATLQHPNGVKYAGIDLYFRGKLCFEKAKKLPYKPMQMLKIPGTDFTVRVCLVGKKKITVDYGGERGMSDWVDPLDFETI